MSKIDDSENIKDINIPGAHDSSTQYCRFSLFSRCQSLSINEMLNIGVRAFDLRVDGENAVHSFCKCKETRFGKTLKFYNVIETLRIFLEHNPTETVLLFFKNDGKISGEICLNLLRDKINENPESWYLENKFPKISEVRGKIILINRINSEIGIDFSAMPYQGSNKTFDAQLFSVDGVDTVLVQDRCTLSRKKKWSRAVLPILESGEKYEGYFIFNHLSSAGIPYIPSFNARYINREFLNDNLKPNGCYGTVMVDFINFEVARKIINTN